jgi:hypothetical protein
MAGVTVRCRAPRQSRPPAASRPRGTRRVPRGAYSRTGGPVLPARAAATTVAAVAAVAAVAVAVRAGVPLVTAASRVPAGPGARHPFVHGCHSLHILLCTLAQPCPSRAGAGRPRGGGRGAGSRRAGGSGPGPARLAGRTGVRPGQHPSRVPAVLAGNALTPAIKTVSPAQKREGRSLSLMAVMRVIRPLWPPLNKTCNSCVPVASISPGQRPARAPQACNFV